MVKAKAIEWREEHDGIHRDHIYHNGYIGKLMFFAISYNEKTESVSAHYVYLSARVRSIAQLGTLQEEKDRAKRLLDSFVQSIAEVEDGNKKVKWVATGASLQGFLDDTHVATIGAHKDRYIYDVKGRQGKAYSIEIAIQEAEKLLAKIAAEEQKQ